MIELPWFPKACAPNHRSRSHWPKTRAMKKTRDWGYAATLAAFPPGSMIRCDKNMVIPVLFTFYPPTAAKHDDDNLGASVKGFRDGIAQALNMDDNRFQMRPIQIGKPVKGGKIVVVLG